MSNIQKRLEYSKAATQAGTNALKVSLLINGAAAIAMLTFIGNIANRNQVDTEIIQALASPLHWFSSGILLSALATGITYIALEFFASNRMNKDKVGWKINVIAIVTTAISYCYFWSGGQVAYNVFLHWHQ